jgi:hypothetical protein
MVVNGDGKEMTAESNPYTPQRPTIRNIIRRTMLSQFWPLQLLPAS